jgi:hypothetical protein
MSPRLVPRTRTLQIYFLFDHLVPLQDKTTYGFLLVEQAVVQVRGYDTFNVHSSTQIPPVGQ